MTEQLDLFTRTHARASDPDTSHEAAALVRSAAVMKARLLAAFAAAPSGLSAEQASDAAGYTPADGAWKRVSDLEREGAIADTGVRVLSSHGRRVRVLAVVPGEEAAR